MSSSESGRKLNQAVNTTSKAVGGALSQAKGAFSNLWSAFTAPPPTSIVPITTTSDDDIAEATSNETDEEKTECGNRKRTVEVEKGLDASCNRSE